MSIASGDKVFYYMTRDSLCFLAMTESRYPKRLAFLYLDEIGDLILGALVNEFGNDVSNRILSWLKSTSYGGRAVKVKKADHHTFTQTPSLHFFITFLSPPLTF